ncbi:hypothetical protein KGM48_02815 [Patescibacteria group bacterium]|nr:hypothetical protein [Patescibacteria group bacterium]
MRTIFKIPQRLRYEILNDLHRDHPFASERVGFISCHAAIPTEDVLLILATAYEPIPDDEYLDDPSAGAVIGPDAILRALRLGLHEGQGDISVFHVHHHWGDEIPFFSRTDSRETRNFVPDFFHTAPHMPHGALILSDERACGRVWLAENKAPEEIEEIIAVGMPTDLLHLP